jgi:hypothetical protein
LLLEKISIPDSSSDSSSETSLVGSSYSQVLPNKIVEKISMLYNNHS